MTAFKALVEYAEQAFGFLDVAVAGAFVFVVLAGEFMEEAHLAEHRADAAHLEHQPLDCLVAAGGILRDELAGLVREKKQDRAGLEQCERAAVRAVGVDDRGDLVVGVEREEFRGELVVGLETDQVRLVGQAGLFQHDRHLDAVGRGQRVELQSLRVGGGPLAGDGVSGQVWHANSGLDGERARIASNARPVMFPVAACYLSAQKPVWSAHRPSGSGEP
ncbi:hypothetical protein FQZ97_899830 [compost metagenome]